MMKRGHASHRGRLSPAHLLARLSGVRVPSDCGNLPQESVNTSSAVGTSAGLISSYSNS